MRKIAENVTVVCFMFDDRGIDKSDFLERDEDVIAGFSEETTAMECCRCQPTMLAEKFIVIELWRWNDFDLIRLVCSMKEKLFMLREVYRRFGMANCTVFCLIKIII